MELKNRIEENLRYALAVILAVIIEKIAVSLGQMIFNIEEFLPAKGWQ